MENLSTNPYQAPEAELDPVIDPQNLAFGDPQKKPVGHGWQWIKDAFALFKHSPGGWIITMLIGLVLFVAISLIPIIGGLFMMLTTYVWAAGLVHGCGEQEKGNKFKLSYLFAGFKLAPGKLIGLSFVISIVSAVIMIACVGSVYMDLITGAGNPDAIIGQDPLKFALSMLIGFALYLPLMMAGWFAPALIIFHQFSIFKAMKASFSGCLRNIMPFLVYGIIFFVFFILAIIPIGLGYLIVMPMMYASMYTAYKDIYLRQGE
ncbi:BPSS1780 family membrane protein [Catenovulum sp. 2E275]|uniref:BPSS1780 family membrane protein n=1 Tax=Catenovulum sp. 2E275 TaxID=2980497 RepID=UPI0021D32A9C|nr:BPSS1780 family membrane protein [Catenovulum sp. 2E275]MCU4675276.1 BPSS1780 family membrane protein [Catenovulum sp. 2E275]